MKLCSKEHEEVCFEGYDCPACEAKAIIQKEMDTMANQHNEKIDDMEAEKIDMEEEITELKCRLEQQASEKIDVEEKIHELKKRLALYE